MSNAAKLVLESVEPGSDREAEELIDSLLADATFEAADEDRVTDRATLEDMLGEAEVIRIRGMEFHAVPPSIKTLSGVLALLGKSDKVMSPPAEYLKKLREAADGELIETWEPSREASDMALSMRIGAARRLLWVMDDNGSAGASPSLRMARADEIGDRFPATRLLSTILTILTRNGLELDDEKKSLSRIGKTSSAD